MSKKTATVLSVILFIVLCILIVCERKWPEAGSSLIYGSTILMQGSSVF